MTELFLIKLAIFSVIGFLVVIVGKEIAIRMKREPASGAGFLSIAGSIANEPLNPIDVFVRRILKTVLVAGGLFGAYLLLTVPARDGSRPDAGAGLDQNQTIRLTKRQKLEHIKIQSLSWSKDGFGAVMMATFRIDNENPIPIKDVEVTCVHSTNSGTMIDKNTRTVYELINANSYYYVHGFNMGFIHNQAVSSRCYVSNFVDR